MSSQMFQSLEKDLFNTGPRATGAFPREKSNHSIEDVKIIDKMTDISFINPSERYGSMDIAQQPNTSNETQNSDVIMTEVRVQTPVSRVKGQKNSPPEANDAPIKAKRKRRAKNLDMKDSPNVHSSPRRPFTLNGDSSSNEVPPYSPSRGITPNNASSSGYSPSNENPTRDAHVQTEKVILNDADEMKMNLQNRTLENEKLKKSSIIKTHKIKELLIEKMKEERKKIRNDILYNNRRIGYFKVTSQILPHGCENWIDGSWKEEIDRRQCKLQADKEYTLQEKKSLRKKKTVKESKKVAESDSDDIFLRPEPPLQGENDRKDEIIKAREEYLKKEEAEITTEREKLERERNLHIREIKRVQHEDDSVFNNYELLNNRYLPLALLGKGGFSEVWRAFDIEKCNEVACKIHRVNKHWNESKKANYVRHAIREKDIHKKLDHSNIVKLEEVFSIDNDAFCTVLEYCDGNDLDHYLKQHGCLTEKETRLVIGQVVDALRYLVDQKVIHYDLKPANILLRTGCRKFEVKITDFGLSKSFDNSEDCDTIELTSQGAGTYWYLPPETFKEVGNAKINSKVDVWSVGVICYQCIYGKRPFGHEQTQQRILTEGTILKATVVNFPPKPVVTAAAQDFIRKCLQYESSNRADVFELSKHEFVKFTRKPSSASQPQSPSSRLPFNRDDLDH